METRGKNPGKHVNVFVWPVEGTCHKAFALKISIRLTKFFFSFGFKIKTSPR